MMQLDGRTVSKLSFRILIMLK
uniref:Uncharacterized protein n=1 Tax=Arundo donax TaxID=35708 RepID=A0A0A8ZLQ7_ARUDO